MRTWYLARIEIVHEQIEMDSKQSSNQLSNLTNLFNLTNYKKYSSFRENVIAAYCNVTFDGESHY